MPRTDSACEPPTNSGTPLGATAIDTRAGGDTVTVAVAVLPPAATAMCATPAVEGPAEFTAVTTPAALTVATALLSELNVAPEVRSSVDESLKVPVTVSACEPLIVRVGAEGATAIDSSVGSEFAVLVEGWQPARTRLVQTTRPSSFNCLTRFIRCLRMRCTKRGRGLPAMRLA